MITSGPMPEKAWIYDPAGVENRLLSPEASGGSASPVQHRFKRYEAIGDWSGTVGSANFPARRARRCLRFTVCQEGEGVVGPAVTLLSSRGTARWKPGACGNAAHKFIARGSLTARRSGLTLPAAIPPAIPGRGGPWAGANTETPGARFGALRPTCARPTW